MVMFLVPLAIHNGQQIILPLYRSQTQYHQTPRPFLLQRAQYHQTHRPFLLQSKRARQKIPLIKIGNWSFHRKTAMGFIVWYVKEKVLRLTALWNDIINKFMNKPAKHVKCNFQKNASLTNISKTTMNFGVIFVLKFFPPTVHWKDIMINNMVVQCPAKDSKLYNQGSKGHLNYQ